MGTKSLIRSKVVINVESSYEKNKKSYIFSNENFEGKSVLGPNNKYYLIYESTEENKNNLNVLKYEPRKITHIKYGNVESKFVFELNRWTKCYCYIKGGFVGINCFTEALKAQVENNSARFNIRYKLYVANSSIGTYNLNVAYQI